MPFRGTKRTPTTPLIFNPFSESVITGGLFFSLQSKIPGSTGSDTCYELYRVSGRFSHPCYSQKNYGARMIDGDCYLQSSSNVPVDATTSSLSGTLTRWALKISATHRAQGALKTTSEHHDNPPGPRSLWSQGAGRVCSARQYLPSAFMTLFLLAELSLRASALVLPHQTASLPVPQLSVRLWSS
ncbi:MAG: hypothetical protein XXXJIFNMEKO3_03043 [Candidatus Erwinia impunctatus]|nr:hypothetical protein XXXJIFNMEKO_03043 [Culicoides impunctatus]